MTKTVSSRIVTTVLVASWLIAGCTGSGSTESSTTLVEQTTTAGQTTDTEVPASTTGVPATTAAGEVSAGAIPADCAEGFAEYLVMIEPIVAELDLAAATVDEFFGFEDAVNAKEVETLEANGFVATYSCPEVGIDFGYFDLRSPWEAIFEIAQSRAPGTLAYLEALEAASVIQDDQMSDYDVATCDDAAERIKQAVAEQVAAGTPMVGEMSFDEGLALIGLYFAYNSAIRAGSCPPDVLGNDEWGFMGRYG